MLINVQFQLTTNIIVCLFSTKSLKIIMLLKLSFHLTKIKHFSCISRYKQSCKL